MAAILKRTVGGINFVAVDNMLHIEQGGTRITFVLSAFLRTVLPTMDSVDEWFVAHDNVSFLSGRIQIEDNGSVTYKYLIKFLNDKAFSDIIAGNYDETGAQEFIDMFKELKEAAEPKEDIPEMTSKQSVLAYTNIVARIVFQSLSS